ncbi:MAG: HAD family hydrolase [Patescibacteria group bacterium]
MNENVVNKQKETLPSRPQAIIFDLDGTLAVSSRFYDEIYAETLVDLVRETKGEEAVEILLARDRLDGKGELTLLSMGIPYRLWAERLIAAPLDLITPQPDIVSAVRSIWVKKLLYTGSPEAFAYRLLERIGFDPRKDFELILGWKEPEIFPLKWSNSPFVFASITALLRCDPQSVWSVGDNWETDLEPAKRIGITTIQIRKATGAPDFRFPDVPSLITAFQNGGTS